MYKGNFMVDISCWVTVDQDRIQTLGAQPQVYKRAGLARHEQFEK
jgi:hypothetical protein